MKTMITILLSLLVPVISTAASSAVYQAASPVPAEYKLFKVDWIVTNMAEHHSLRPTSVTIESPNSPFSGMYPADVVRDWEQQVDVYTAEKVLTSKWDSGCGEGYEAKALVTVAQPFLSAPLQNNLKMTLKISTTNDTCHSKPTVQYIKYNLVRAYKP
ncbi:MAG: hypothetical protein ACK41T_10015 [Pseudobdellovibrio sp.]